MISEQEVRERIEKLKNERSEFVILAEKRLASFDGGIGELELLLAKEIEENVIPTGQNKE